MTAHIPVLLTESIEALVTRADGTYVDCTYGRGGHSQAIADLLAEQGRLLVIDRDAEAISDARSRFAGDERIEIRHGSFTGLPAYINDLGWAPLDGVLLDLGVSSPQFDTPSRGFSFSADGPLDMRMDTSQGLSAAEWLASADEDEITLVLKHYGEERFARRIARKICSVREESPILSTRLLVELIETAVPKRDPNKHPATRTFQAIRIHVNRELDELKECLDDVVSLLSSGGRLVVISFHSLEDRIVKRFMRDQARGPALPRRLPITDSQIQRNLKVVGKAVRPGEVELSGNRRARSSIMRVAEKL